MWPWNTCRRAALPTLRGVTCNFARSLGAIWSPGSASALRHQSGERSSESAPNASPPAWCRRRRIELILRYGVADMPKSRSGVSWLCLDCFVPKTFSLSYWSAARRRLKGYKADASAPKLTLQYWMGWMPLSSGKVRAAYSQLHCSSKPHCIQFGNAIAPMAPSEQDKYDI